MDWIASSLTLTSMYLFADGWRRTGAAVGLAAQALWIPIAIHAGLMGMLTLEVIALGIYGYGFWKRSL